MKRTIAAAFAVMLSMAQIAHSQEVKVAYLRQEPAPNPTLSNLDPAPKDMGVAGAELALKDNATTGRFMGQNWSLDVVSVPYEGDFAKGLAQAQAISDLILIDAPDAQLSQAVRASQALFFNVSNRSTALRNAGCSDNLLHTIPSQAMLADALMQFALRRKWTRLTMIKGVSAQDEAIAVSYAKAAGKFGQTITATKTWAFDADMRRNAAQEVPLFTQDLGEYDLLLLADAANDFARYVPFNTWRPRPTAGAEGLRPVAWDPVVEQWGAAQLQSRFEDLASRPMARVDYAAWAALRSIGEAVTRTKSNDLNTLRSYLLSEEFELAGFKGRPMTYRSWNGQLRQPIPLVHRGALVAQAPLEGFLHQHTELDTLGTDQPETGCTAFKP
ncbi:MAG: ABC transporter substrate-binding protein [Pelagimonas sp.]|jgi:ABC transporter substrate binding protein (PQQ-dependent alcohol dehydrogenase system)|nr:ABC transporter substrate-binding protein [Pelagimonas sp.]